MARRSMHRHPCLISPPKALGKVLEQTLSFFLASLEVSEYILNEDYRRIHDDAEIYCADREQVRAFSLDHQENDCEEQRKRNVQSDDDGAAEITEKNPLDHEDQKASENQVVQNSVGSY